MNIIKKNQRISFGFPTEIILIEAIEEILKNNTTEESDEEFFDKFTKGIETKTIIIRDAAITIFEEKIPEEKTVELLAKHLETSPETAQKIATDIKQKLVPFAKIVSDEEPKKEAPAITAVPAQRLPYGKQVEIRNVEENAKKMAEEEQEESEKVRTVVSPEVNKPRTGGESDPYKEAIE